LVLALAALATVRAGAQNQPEEFARRQYESGVSFMQNRKYAEALKDFQAVADQYPTTRFAGSALLEIARYQLEIAGDADAAGKVADALVRKYPTGDATPMAYVLLGRVVLATKGLGPAEIDAALASFERVRRLFPGSDAIPAATFYAGEALRLAHRNPEALDRFRQVSIEYPRSPWTARAELSAGICLTLSQQPTRAMEELQRVRARFSGTPEAARALAWNTILYRLYVKAPAQPPFALSARTVGDPNRVKDAVSVALNGNDQVFIATRTGVAAFDQKGAARPAPRLAAPRALFFDVHGTPWAAQDATVQADGGNPIALVTPVANDKPKPLEQITAAVTLSSGELLVADHHTKVIYRFSPAGKYLGAFAAFNATRLAIDALDQVAALDHDEKVVALFDRDGKTLVRIPAKGTGYEFGNLTDLAYDALGHLYVLDRDRGSVFVFDPTGKLVTAFTPKGSAALDKAAALGVDSAGRLYVFDERAQRVQVYQ
jgi:TolA-binding protein